MSICSEGSYWTSASLNNRTCIKCPSDQVVTWIDDAIGVTVCSHKGSLPTDESNVFMITIMCVATAILVVACLGACGVTRVGCRFSLGSRNLARIASWMNWNWVVCFPLFSLDYLLAFMCAYIPNRLQLPDLTPCGYALSLQWMLGLSVAMLSIVALMLCLLLLVRYDTLHELTRRTTWVFMLISAYMCIIHTLTYLIIGTGVVELVDGDGQTQGFSHLADRYLPRSILLAAICTDGANTALLAVLLQTQHGVLPTENLVAIVDPVLHQIGIEEDVDAGAFVAEHCAICLETAPTIQFPECGHRAVCPGCFASFMEACKNQGRSTFCPICRIAIGRYSSVTIVNVVDADVDVHAQP